MELGFLFAAFADTTTYYSFARERLGFPFVRFIWGLSDLCVFGPLFLGDVQARSCKVTCCFFFFFFNLAILEGDLIDW